MGANELAVAFIPAKPGPSCKTCLHPKVEQINAALMTGDPIRALAGKWGLSRQSVTRHRDNCIPTPAMAAGARAVLEAEGIEGASLAEQASSLHRRALTLLDKAEASDDLRTAFVGIREVRDCLLAMGKLTGLVDDNVTVNISLAPELVTGLVSILLPFPEARQAVIGFLGGMSGRSAPLLIEGNAS